VQQCHLKNLPGQLAVLAVAGLLLVDQRRQKGSASSSLERAAQSHTDLDVPQDGLLMRFTGVVAPALSELIRVEDIPRIRAAESFDGFFSREYRSVLGLAIVLSGRRAVAEELTQDAFLAAFRDWDRVGRLDNPGAWVRRVVANRSVSVFRRTVAEAKALILFNSQPRRDMAPELDDSMDLWREVRRLPRRQAQVVALTYLDDLPRRQVAEILECGEETVKTHLERARNTLAGRLKASREDRHGR